MSRPVLSPAQLSTLFVGTYTKTGGDIDAVAAALFEAGGGRVAGTPVRQQNQVSIANLKQRHAETARFTRTRFEWLFQAVADRHGITVTQLLARHDDTSCPAVVGHRELCWLLRRDTDGTGALLIQVVGAMLDRHHGSVSSACGVVEAKIAERPEYRDELLALLGEQGAKRAVVGRG